MNGEISNRNQNRFLYKAVNMFKSAVKSGILTWGSLTYYHWLTFGASLQWLCRELQFFGTGFIFRSRSLPLGWRSSMSCLFLHFHPYDQRLAQALKASKGGEERMNICCPFSSLCLLFIPSLLLYARPSVLCWLWHLFISLCMHCSSYCAYLSNTAQQWQWHCSSFEKGLLYMLQNT